MSGGQWNEDAGTRNAGSGQEREGDCKSLFWVESLARADFFWVRVKTMLVGGYGCGKN